MTRSVSRGLSYRYGVQHVTLPAAAVTVDRSTLRRGDEVEVSSLRSLVRGLVATWNSTDPDKVRVKVGEHGGGVRLAATNPWNHKTVSYAVTAAGHDVMVTRL